MMVDDRILERRADVREQRRRRRLRRTITVGVLLGVLVVAYAVERSSLVALAEVRVEGVQRLDADLVRETADLPLGTSTLRLRLGEAAERVRALPLVEHVDVRRADPLTVVVEIVEREPWLVAVDDAGAVLVDDEGVVIDEGRLAGLPVVHVPGRAGLEPGDRVDRAASLANAHAVVAGMPGPLRQMVDRYEATSADNLELVLDNGVRVRFGRGDRVDEKARALGAVLEDLDGRSVTAIDVRAPSRPVVEP